MGEKMVETEVANESREIGQSQEISKTRYHCFCCCCLFVLFYNKTMEEGSSSVRKVTVNHVFF